MSSRAHRGGRAAQLQSWGVFGAHRRTGESVGGQGWAVWAWVRTGWAEGTRGARWGGAPEATLPGGHLPQVGHPLRGRLVCAPVPGVGGAPRHQPPANKRERLRRTKCPPGNCHPRRVNVIAGASMWPGGAIAIRGGVRLPPQHTNPPPAHKMRSAQWLPRGVVGYVSSDGW